MDMRFPGFSCVQNLKQACSNLKSMSRTMPAGATGFLKESSMNFFFARGKL